MIQEEIYIKSTIDNTMQPSLLYRADTTVEGKRPLLVGLHTWSHDRYNQIGNMLPYAEKYNFHLLLPEFRGSNLSTNPICKEACGSLLAKQDIKDAIDYCLAEGFVDQDNIFILGLSGGGHMTLMMAGFCPEYFKAAGAFVPITNLEKWTEQNAGYRKHVLACCGDDKEEMLKRSPINYIENIAKCNVKIFHGKHDPVVPMSHSFTFYEEMLRRYPEAKVYLDIFDGGHEVDMDQAMYWFMSQSGAVTKTEVTG